MPTENTSNTFSKNKKKGIKVAVNFAPDQQVNNLNLDFMALMLDQQGKLVSDNHFIFYNNPRSSDGSVEHLGDVMIDTNDYQQIIVNKDKIDTLVKRIIFVLNIDDAESKKQTFALVNNLKITFTNLENRVQLAEYLPENDG